ncbi:MAG: hypothetical protein B7X02_02960 [Rhodospirillales bacterium 12-54-5]|nr:MAG: hypothetical protein B7X02_02960 [Rhodospirillales bacterium 12-54-5]
MTERPTIDFPDSTRTASDADSSPTIPKAVALAHDRESGDTPRIVASGKGFVAEQILKIAFDRGIKVRQDAELVDVLSLIDVDSPIPLEAFAAVAEILAHVYKVNDAAKHRAPPPKPLEE